MNPHNLGRTQDKHESDWSITHGTNEEGSTWAILKVIDPDGSTWEKHFFQSFEEPGESALVQASSFANAMTEAEEFSLEERLGPFGIEWEREQEERGAWC